MTTTPGMAVLWPPSRDSSIPEPLLSHIHALVLVNQARLPLWEPSGADLADRPPWHRTLRAQIQDVAVVGSELRDALVEHLERFGRPGGDTEYVSGLMRSLITDMALFERRPHLAAWDVPDREERWLRQWAEESSRAPVEDLVPVTRDDLLVLRLDMCDLDAVSEVIDAAGGATLRRLDARNSHPHDRAAVVLDVDKIAENMHGHDPSKIARLVDRAVQRRHAIGLLDRGELLSLGLTPTDHPCGIDLAASEYPHELDELHSALVGRSARHRIVLEWARHEGLSWGEDEDLMFFVEELPGLHASLDDPWNVKADEVRAQIDKILSHNPKQAAELKQYRYRSALHELFDAWRMPEYFHTDLAMSLDNAARQLAHQGLLAELTDSLDEVVSSSHDDDSARLAFGDALEGIVVADGPDGCYRSLALALRDRLHGMRDSQVWPPASSVMDIARCQRTSTFVDDATDVRVREALVELHRDQVEAFLSGATGSDHLVLYADLSDVLGVIGSVIIGDEPTVSTFTASGGVVATTCAAMVMARVDGEVGVVAAYPDVPLDPVIRATYPALCQFFTTAFHQKSVSAVTDVARTMRELRNPAWTAVRDELTLLLHVDDEVELRRIVENCGSYLLPAQTRHWVQCLLWRFDAFDWHPDREG